MIKDAEVENGTSFTTRLVQNLSMSVNMLKNADVNEGGNNGNNEIVKRSTFFKKTNKSIE